MLISNNNYNVLGKVGPHYERPEYRPPEQTDQSRSPAPEQTRGDRQTLSTKNTDVPAKKISAAPTGKLSLDSARNLVAETANLISTLPPQSTDREPHLDPPSSLMSPVYV